MRMEELNRAAKIKLEHVPYQGGSAYLSDIISGRVDLAADGSIVLPQVKKGIMNAIAIFSDKRSKEFPDVPTVNEVVPEYEKISSWQVYMAPAGTPGPVIKRIADAVKDISRDEETATFLQNVTFVPVGDGNEGGQIGKE